MKKKILSLALIVAIVAILSIGTLAYFTDSTEETVNTFTVGNVEIEIDEPSWKEPETVEPGIAVDKDPLVKNTGKNDAWIRINVTLSDWAAFSAAGTAHGITDLTTVFGEFKDADWTLAGTPVVDATADTITYSYYYNTVVEADGGTTSALFTSVTVPAAFTSDEMEALGDDFTITVTADAIQADGLETVEAAFAAFDAE